MVAASAAAMAIGVIIVGSRRREKDKYHPLRGVLERRMKLFGGMADNCFGERELCGAQQQGNNSFETEDGKPAEYKEMV